MNLIDLFAIARQRTPNKPALRFAASGAGADYTYAELFDAADRLAAGLQAWGLTQGDRVAFFMDNRPEFVIAYLAVIRLGAGMVPINLRYRRLEIRHMVADSTPRLIITEAALCDVLDDAGYGRGGELPLLLAEEIAAWERPASELQPPVVAADDPALIMYTSGTTGRSKGAVLSHNNVLASVTGLLAAWGWQADDRLLLVLPLFHTHGLTVGLHCALAAGATVLLRTKYEAGRTLDELLSGEPTLFFAVPTIYVRLVE